MGRGVTHAYATASRHGYAVSVSWIVPTAGLPRNSNSILLPLAAGASSQNADSFSNAAWYVLAERFLMLVVNMLRTAGPVQNAVFNSKPAVYTSLFQGIMVALMKGGLSAKRGSRMRRPSASGPA